MAAPSRCDWRILLFCVVTVSVYGVSCRELTGLSAKAARALLKRRPDVVLDLKPQSWIGAIDGRDGEDGGVCRFPPGDADTACGAELVCIPVLALDAAPVDETISLTQDITFRHFGFLQQGITAARPVESDLPLPIGYFPLSQDLSSWPFPVYATSTPEGIAFEEDDTFGPVLDCASGPLMMPSVDFTSSGDWTVALWFKGGRDSKGSLYEHTTMPPSQSRLDVVLDTQENELKIEITDQGGRSISYSSINALPDADLSSGWHFVTVVAQSGDVRDSTSAYLDGVCLDFSESSPSPTPDTEGRILDGDIELCPVREDATGSGSGLLSHLLLFDVALTRDAIETLYAAQFVSAAQLLPSEDTSEPILLTEDGAECVFPAVSRGERTERCVLVNGIQQCPVRYGGWSNCSSASQLVTNIPFITHTDSPLTEEVEIYSVSGQRCLFPTFFHGRPVSECVPIRGEPRCLVGDGVWEVCSRDDMAPSSTAPTPRNLTIYGQTCVEDCGWVSSTWSCLTATGETLPCAIRPNQLPDASPILSRVTTDDQECVFPLWLTGRLVAECFDELGSDRCLDVDGELKTCKPVRRTLEGYPCAIPFPFEDELQFDCITIDGTDSCLTADGALRSCAPRENVMEPHPPARANLTTLAGRITYTADLCMFPFWHQDQLHTTCVARSKDDPREVCRTVSGVVDACYPQRRTIDGEPCALPFRYERRTWYDCAPFPDGSLACRTVDGDYVTCDLSDGVPLFDSLFAPAPEGDLDDAILDELESGL